MNDKRKPLGRGLASLLPSRPAAAPGAQAAPAMAPAAPAGEVVQEIPVGEIERNPYQTRSDWSEQALEELTASIAATGVLQPIVVRHVAEGQKYQLIAGERRWRASQKAGKETIPAIVRRVSDLQALEMTIIENLQREDLNPMDEARGFERLIREFKLTQEEVAKRTSKERATIANYLRLLKLPDEVQVGVETGALSMGHAKVLLMLEDPELITQMGRRVFEGGLSVRATEELVHSLIQPKERVRKAKAEREVDPNVREQERELERALGCRVRINDRNGRGSIQIEYATLEDFDRVLEVLGAQR
jgi:ParB family chromosome partitioning protein